jgi:hypothetical protein
MPGVVSLVERRSIVGFVGIFKLGEELLGVNVNNPGCP